ncbi:MAG: NnrU family protein [Sphingomonas bacterium]|nr:NnrU family protein [Sphingomonas bacterium]
MTEFLLALGVFLLSHTIPTRTGLRHKLTAAVGERRYLLLYSILSIALLIWLISAALRAPFVLLWNLAQWQYDVPIALMLPASMLFVGGLFASNPLSISFSRASFDAARPGLVGITRHPLLWAFALWSFALLFPNGDLVSVILFGGFTLFSLAGMALVDRRKRTALGDEWRGLAAQTSIIPLAALVTRRASPRWSAATLVTTVAGGAALYFILLRLHPVVFGIDPLAGLG